MFSFSKGGVRLLTDGGFGFAYSFGKQNPPA